MDNAGSRDRDEEIERRAHRRHRTNVRRTHLFYCASRQDRTTATNTLSNHLASHTQKALPAALLLQEMDCYGLVFVRVRRSSAAQLGYLSGKLFNYSRNSNEDI